MKKTLSSRGLTAGPRLFIKKELCILMSKIKHRTGRFFLLRNVTAWVPRSSRGMTAFFLSIVFYTQTIYADTNPPSPPGQSGQVSISASKNQMTQVKSLFNQSDYQHLANPTNVVSSLALNEP